MVDLQLIQSKIYEIRGQRVMLDFDLAQMYGTETKVLKQAVKRNIKRFPTDFMFELNDEEVEELSRCKNSNNRIFPCGAVLCYRFLFGKHRCQRGNEV